MLNCVILYNGYLEKQGYKLRVFLFFFKKGKSRIEEKRSNSAVFLVYDFKTQSEHMGSIDCTGGVQLTF